MLTLAAIGGIALASMHLSKKQVKLWMALIHGAFALPGVALLFWATVVREWPALMTASLVLLLAAAAGGVIMFLMHGKRKAMPKGLILGHGALAGLGYIGLLIALFV